jgi:anaerobic magnesium-protoporphyrin IX monomethyl ester cyclase
MGQIEGASPSVLPPLASPRENAADHLRLLLLHPKTLVDSWPFPVDTLGEIVKFPSAVYPILAAAIRDLPVAVEIFDGYVARESFRAYKHRLMRAQVIGISAMSPLKALDTELTVRLAKRLNPGVKIVMGGNHATAWPDRWLSAGADYVVAGEGEIAFRMLMSFLACGKGRLQDIPNLLWMEGGQVQRSGARAPQIDLETAPLPDWSGFDLRPYGLGLSGGQAAAVEFSRGCPHRCDFCNINTFWNYKQRTKSVARVIAELEHLKSRGVAEFIFTDDNFGGDERRTIALLNEMVARGLNMRFGCFLRGDTVHRNPDFAALAARAGMRFCMMGIETLDPAWLKRHRKGVRATDALAMYERVYDSLRANGIFVVGLFITAPIGERGDYAGKGAAGRVCDTQFAADLAALKGSALYEDLRQKDRVAKDMFYHDWNFPSIIVEEGKTQRLQKSFLDLVRDYTSLYAVRSALFGTPVARRFRWRPVGILMERLLCTTPADIWRWRIARTNALDLQARQDRIVQSLLNDRAVARLARRRWWRSPLALRTGGGWFGR